MKNLKKVLALVLVVAMIMGIAVSASAFSDVKTYEKNTEAVDVMSMLKIINGYTDGTFRGDKTVTRAEMAKMICYIVAGGEDVGDLYKGANTFTDCANHWAKGYIAYAAKTGIVAGTGKGLFNPNGTVTGTQAAKMLLCALGYDATNEKYVGANWDVNVLAKADEIGLLDDLTSKVMANYLTRADAAQMMFNALTKTMVKYANGGTTVTTPDGTTVSTGAATADFVANNSGFDYAGRTNATMELCEKYFGKDLTYSSTNKVDDFGRPSHQWKYNKDTVTVADEAKLVYTAAVKGTDLKADLKDEDLAIADDGVKIVRNGGDVSTMSKADVNTFLGSSNTEGGNGTVIEVYGANDEVTKIVVIATYLAKVDKIIADKASTKTEDETALQLTVYMGLNQAGTAATTKSITSLKDDSAIGFDAAYAKVEKDDYVLVTPKGDNSSSSKIVSIAIPEVVSGKKTSSGSGYIKVDGNKLDTADTFYLNAATFDNTCDFYKDTYGNVIGAVETTAADEALNYLHVDSSKGAAGDGFDDASLKLKVTYLDGTTATVNYEIKKATSTTAPGTTLVDGDFYIVAPNGDKTEVASSAMIAAGYYSYKVNDDKTVVLTALKSNKAAQTLTTTDVGAVSGKTYTVKDDARIYASAANNAEVKGVATATTVLSVIKDGKVSTYTGYKNFPTQEFSDVNVLYVYKTDSKTLTNVYVLGGAVSEETTYAIYTGKGENTSDGQYYNFYVGGETKSYIVTDTNFVDAAASLKSIWTLTVTDNKADPAAPADGKMIASVKVTACGDNYLVYQTDAGTNGDPKVDHYVYFMDDVQIYNVVDADNITTDKVEVDDVVTICKATSAGNTDKAAVIYITNDNT